MRVAGASVVAKRLDRPPQQLKVSVARLLAVGDDGQGCYYSFQGWRSGRYRTWAQLASREGEYAVLVVPEWHPARPVRILGRLLPVDVHDAGRWLEIDGDLSATSPARLQLRPFGTCEPPPATVCHQPRSLPPDHGAIGVDSAVPVLGGTCQADPRRLGGRVG